MSQKIRIKLKSYDHNLVDKSAEKIVRENCIVESRDTIRANTTYIGTPENIKIVIEKNERYTL